MNQITTRYITENGACYEQYVITDPEAKTALTITPERGGMITSFTLDGEEFVWTRRPNFSECNRPRFGVPVLFPSFPLQSHSPSPYYCSFLCKENLFSVPLIKRPILA